MLKRNRKFFQILSYLLAITGVFLIVSHFQNKKANNILSDIPSKSYDQIVETKNLDSDTVPEQPFETISNPPLPEKFLLKAAFQSQAPYGDWSQPYQDGCEEASIIIAKHYLMGQTLSKTEMKQEIDDAVSWQVDNWGGHFDLNAEKTLQLARDYFGIEGKIVRNYQIDDLKRYLSEGKPIIAPTAGRLLGNPNFTGAGPEYHMLVVVGYNNESEVFITNDPGTRKGENYIYKYQTLLDAISGPNINTQKEVLILYL